jgi:hypothetical protein
MATLLDRVFSHEESKTQEELLKHVVDQAGFSSQVEVVEWLLGRCSLLGVSNASVVKVQNDALQHSHTASLMSLHKHQLLRETSEAIAWMVSEAAQARQGRSSRVAAGEPDDPSETHCQDSDRCCSSESHGDRYRHHSQVRPERAACSRPRSFWCSCFSSEAG